jgi:TonB family protein
LSDETSLDDLFKAILGADAATDELGTFSTAGKRATLAETVAKTADDVTAAAVAKQVPVDNHVVPFEPVALPAEIAAWTRAASERRRATDAAASGTGKRRFGPRARNAEAPRTATGANQSKTVASRLLFVALSTGSAAVVGLVLWSASRPLPLAALTNALVETVSVPSSPAAAAEVPAVVPAVPMAVAEVSLPTAATLADTDAASRVGEPSTAAAVDSEPRTEPALTREPMLLSSTTPVYPEHARRKGSGDKVDLNVMIDKAGKVVRAAVVTGPPHLRAAAISTVLQWRYEPASMNGAPVATRHRVRVSFE